MSADPVPQTMLQNDAVGHPEQLETRDASTPTSISDPPQSATTVTEPANSTISIVATEKPRQKKHITSSSLYVSLIVDMEEGREHSQGYLEAQIDTGACANFITASLLESLREKGVKQSLDTQPLQKYTIREGTASIQSGSGMRIRTFDNHWFDITETVKLSFKIGNAQTVCLAEFEVLPPPKVISPDVQTQDIQPAGKIDPAQDGNVDILLGASFLFDYDIIKLGEVLEREPVDTSGMEALEIRPEVDDGFFYSDKHISSSKTIYGLKPGPSPRGR